MVYAIMIPLLAATGAWAQALQLRQIGATESGAIEIAVVAELAGARASGISFYVAIPEGAFAVVEAGRPFAQGPLLAPAVEFLNETMVGAIGAPAGVVLLPYAAVRGPGAARGRTGAGEVARFALQPLRPGPLEIALISTSIYEAKLVLDDGVGERAFESLGRLELNDGAQAAAGELPGGGLAPALAPEREKPAGRDRRSWAAIKAAATAP